MADQKYNLSQLFKAAFGINSPIFITQPLTKEQKETFDYKGISVLEDYHKTEKTSHFGTPIIGTITFKAGQYQSYNSNGSLDTAPFENHTLPEATLFSFRRAKNSTKTNLLGSNGTVKEIFGFDDWVIEAKGIALDDSKSSAYDKIKLLEDWVNIAGSIAVSGKLMSRKKIDAIVIEDYKQETIQGSPGIIPFSMTMLSDEAIELILPNTTNKGI